MATVSSSIADEIVECPLCMEPLEVDDLNFFPCTCGYQICRFCWHRIRTDENELCPACRKEYPENPADFKPLSQEEIIAFKFQKRQRDQQRKQKITENRKHLANVRVVQKNLVFVVGLPPRLANAEILKKHEYFGKYGKIHKVVINPSTTYAGVQGPSASAYVTYVVNSDALRAIQSVNNIMIDGRLIKTSLGTTKYCSHFMKNQQCPKSDCMYLHELGDPEASFTKEEMHQGKHQDFEKRLHELLHAGTFFNGSSSTTSDVCLTTISKLTDNKESSLNNTTSVNFGSGCINATNNSSSPICVNEQKKDAWPSLSLSPIHQKEPPLSGSNKKVKDRYKQAKTDKHSKLKCKMVVNHNIIDTASAIKDIDCNLDLDHSLFSDYSVEKTANDQKDNGKKIESFSSQNTEKNKLSDICLKSDNDAKLSKEIKNKNKMCESNENQSSKDDPQNTEIQNIYIDQARVDKEVEMCSASKNCTLNLHEPRTNKLELCLDINPNAEIDKKSPSLHSALLADPSSFSDCTVNINCIEPLDKETLSAIADLKKSKIDGSVQTNGRMMPNLPDLINGIDGYQKNASSENDWENAFQNVAVKTTKNNDNDAYHNDAYQTEDNYSIKYFEDLRRLQDIHRRNALLNSFGTTQLTLSRAGAELYRNTQYVDQQTELLQQRNFERAGQNFSSETNMSKFFDFHKHQQQRIQMQNMQNVSSGIIGGLSENLQMMSILDAKSNSQYVDHNSLTPPPSQYIRSQNICGKSDQMVCYLQHHPKQSSQSSHQSQYIQPSSCTDDDLGFDPFVETQKALAELIENEEEHQNATSQSKPEIKQLSTYHQLSPNDQTSDSIHSLRCAQFDINPNNFGINNYNQRMQTNSKILPFVNLSSSSIEPCSQPNQQHQIANVWGANMGNTPALAACTEIRRPQVNQCFENSKGYTCTDWTAMDPAILSFRQFSFPQHIQMSSQPEQEMYLQQMTHTQQPAVFGQQNQHGGRSNIQNTALSPHQNSHPQVAANVQGMLEYLKNRQCM